MTLIERLEALSGPDDGWSSKDLKSVYLEIERIQATLPRMSTETGCLSSALVAIELADEHIAKKERES